MIRKHSKAKETKYTDEQKQTIYNNYQCNIFSFAKIHIFITLKQTSPENCCFARRSIRFENGRQQMGFQIATPTKTNVHHCLTYQIVARRCLSI